MKKIKKKSNSNQQQPIIERNTPMSIPNNVITQKSEILFIYESTYTIPNGDPFTGEQRYDEETKKILVSDVRIKRYIRDCLAEQGYDIYVISTDESAAEGKGTEAARRFKVLQEKFKQVTNPKEILLECVDARLFGGIVTIKKDKKKKSAETEAEVEDTASFNVTGPVQFALLSPSLNEVELRMHQNTSVFASSEEKKQGAIATTSVVPYAVNQIHGWVNPFSAKETGLTDADVNLMFKALWESINNKNTRTKSNQNSLLLLEIVYSEPTKKLYGLDRFIKLDAKEDKKGEQLRSMDDYEFNFTELLTAVNANLVKEVNYYTETKKIENSLNKDRKFKKMSFPTLK